MIGWRGTFFGIAGIMALAALLIALAIREDPPSEAAAPRETLRQSFSGIPEVFRTDSVGRLFLMNLSTYSSFVLIVGLWGGPYLSHIYGHGLTERGNLLLIPAVTQILGLIAWGPLDRMFGNYKVPVLIGAGITCALLTLMAVLGTLPPVALAVWLGVFGFCAGYTPAVLAHGKSLFAPHLVGRGITLLNMGTMGGAFLSQAISGVAIDLFPSEAGAYPLAAYRLVFALQAGFVLVSCLAYLRARDPLQAANR